MTGPADGPRRSHCARLDALALVPWFVNRLELVTVEPARRVDLLHHNLRKHDIVTGAHGLAAEAVEAVEVVASIDDLHPPPSA